MIRPETTSLRTRGFSHTGITITPSVPIGEPAGCSRSPRGRMEIQGHHVADLVEKSGSLESLTVSVRCAGSTNARQMQPIVRWLRRAVFAIARVLQSVPSRAVLSNVRVSTHSTSASLILRGAPVRSVSGKPWTRSPCGLP